MEQYTPSPALRTSEADLSGRSNERKRCFRLENIRRYFKRTDKTYLLLCIFSSVMAVTALSSWAAKQGNGFAVDEITGQITGLGDYRRAAVQAGAALIGLVIAVLLSNIDYRSLVKVWPVHVALTWGMVLPTLVLRNVSIGPLTIGYNAGDTDNYSWYKLGGFTLQPTELAKISFILTFAMHLNNVRTRLNEPKELGKLLLHLAVPILIIHVQGDDGTAIIYAIIGCCMMFAAGLSWKYIIGAVAAAAAAVAAAFAFFSDKIGKGYQWYRILAVIDPENTTGWAPNETTWKNIIYQQQRGEIALGSGGIFGNGLFGGSYYSVPNAHNDFILSWIGNAAGFVGCESYVADAFGVSLTNRGCVDTDHFKTNVDKVFACGDMRRGQSLVVWGLREGRDCAAEVDRYLMGYTNL